MHSILINLAYFLRDNLNQNGLQRNYNQSMNSFLATNRGKIIFAISTLVVLSFIILSFFTFLTGSFLLAFFLYLLLLLWMVHYIGIMIMYPGSSCITRSSVQLQFSQDLSARMVRCFNALHTMGCCITEGKRIENDNQINFEVIICRHVKGVIDMLVMFEEEGLSKRKTEILKNYRQIDEIINQKDDQRMSIAELTKRPKRLSTFAQQDKEYYALKFEKISTLIKATAMIIESFVPTPGIIGSIKATFFQQSLYEVRFGMHLWSSVINYQAFLIKTQDGEFIESAIIHSFKNKKMDDSGAHSRNTVLFCNPNGCFIQFFFNHEYINHYLQLGYRVILWNYRGYGKSTGSPSIRKAQKDAYSVYSFYHQKKYNIKIVHGYSIGGAAAIGLLQKLRQSKNKNPTDKVQGLIIDRSFSSIPKITLIFGKFVSFFTRVLFFTDSEDFSQAYEQIQCKKLLIWDYKDEIISDIASVKNAILQRSKFSLCKKQKKEVKKNELNQQIEESAVDVVSLIKKFEETIKIMLLSRKRVQEEQKSVIMVNQEHRETSMTTASGLNDYSFEPLLRALAKIDGGGRSLFLDPEQLTEIMNKNEAMFHHLCQSYLLGLICYGSYFPLQPNAYIQNTLKKETQQKINNLLTFLSSLSPADQNYENVLNDQISKNASSHQIHKIFYHIFTKTLQLHQEIPQQEGTKKYGSLLPTSNGHNSPLSSIEFRVLANFIKSTEPNLPTQA